MGKETGQSNDWDTCLCVVVLSFLLSFVYDDANQAYTKLLDASKDSEGRKGRMQVYPIATSDKQTISTPV